MGECAVAVGLVALFWAGVFAARRWLTRSVFDALKRADL